MTHIVPSGWHVSENIFKELDLKKNPDAPVLRAEVVECPLDLVKEDIGIQVLKSTRGGIDAISYQAINMRNPISGMSISQDEGKTWTGLSQEERSAAFLHPKLLDPSLNITVRVEPWMGGSNVQVRIGPITFQDGTVISTKKNNVCRGNPSQLSFTNQHCCFSANCKFIGTSWTGCPTPPATTTTTAVTTTTKTVTTGESFTS